jgi:ubiquitin carboxyl-terminal hydrolase 34
MSVEEQGTTMATNGTATDTPVSLRSDSGSPPIEIISVSADDDAEFDDADSITMLDESGRSFEYDPTISFPFHDNTETYVETVLRLLQYLPTRKSTLPYNTGSHHTTDKPAPDDQVPRAFTEWIEKYLGYVKTASPRAIEDSYFLYRDMWQPVPQLLLHMVNRK